MNHLALNVSPLAVMLFVASITPGPNNLMLMLAGTRFGFVRTLPHLGGITTGSTVVICLTFAGLGSVMLGHPGVVDAMNVACAAYLVWMAWRLLRPAAPGISRGVGGAPAPLGFLDALMFQFVNPKVWTMAVAAAGIAARFPFSMRVSFAALAATAALVNAPCIAVWAAFGKIMQERLASPRVRRGFDTSMAVLVLGTAGWIAWPVLAKL